MKVKENFSFVKGFENIENYIFDKQMRILLKLFDVYLNKKISKLLQVDDIDDFANKVTIIKKAN